ncbi:MAG: hypothetical protein HY898_34115 [Deltaproteobacteria bacterium]|nr:hypothetical protein [Deltaproteobacteria bacterium]
MRDGLVTFIARCRLPLLALAVVLPSAATGCMVEADRCEHCGGMGGPVVGTAGSPSAPAVTTAQIDTGQTLSTDPGVGAGVFIEYDEGGHWHVYTACDSNLYGEGCDWNVVASVGTGQLITDVSIEGAESKDGDTIYPGMDNVELAVTTWSDFDGMRFVTTPGTTVRFDVYLGGLRDARYIYWVGNNAIHKGAPSDPIDLKPSKP